MMPGHVSFGLMPPVTPGSLSGLATQGKIFWFWTSEVAVSDLNSFCSGAAVCPQCLVHAAGDGLLLLVLLLGPCFEYSLAVLLCYLSGATARPLCSHQSLLTAQHAFCPTDIGLPLILNESFVFRAHPEVVRGGPAAHQDAHFFTAFSLLTTYPLGVLQTYLLYKEVWGACL